MISWICLCHGRVEYMNKYKHAWSKMKRAFYIESTHASIMKLHGFIVVRPKYPSSMINLQLPRSFIIQTWRRFSASKKTENHFGFRKGDILINIYYHDFHPHLAISQMTSRYFTYQKENETSIQYRYPKSLTI
jgi:hypothetical protein